MSDISEITEVLLTFRDERNWEQFHNPKDLAIAINVEASELLELFLWKMPGDEDQARVREELADVFAFALLLADRYKLDVKQIVNEKVEHNRLKYPVEKARGNARKYNEL